MVSKASDYKKKSRRELILPSGEVFEVRRPGPEVALRAGRLPQHLFTSMAASKMPGEGDAGETVQQMGLGMLAKMTDQEFGAFMAFARDMVASSVVNPVIKLGATGDDELDPADLDMEDFWHIFNWAFTGGVGIPVQTKGGEIQPEELETFRADTGIRDAGEGGEIGVNNSVADARDNGPVDITGSGLRGKRASKKRTA